MADEHNDPRGEALQSFFAKQQLIDSARAVFQLLSAVVKNATLYPEFHPILFAAADKLKDKLDELLIGRDEAAFYMVGGELFFEKLSVPLDQSLSLLMEHFGLRNVGGVAFKRGITREELTRFAKVINREAAVFSGGGDINAAIRRESVSRIHLHRVLAVDKNTGGAVKAGKQKAAEIFREAVDSVKDLVRSVQLGRISGMRKMNTVVHAMVDNILTNRDAFLGLTSIKMHDEYTFAHSVNVSILSVSLATFLSFSKPQIAALGIAGLMHDIGKLKVPREIINKPGKLTDEEWEAVKRHPVEGALLLANTPGISKLAMVTAFEHHQHGGGRGYPSADGDHGPHPFSQIVSLADAYEAITAPRVYYRSQTPPDEAVRILLQKRGAPFNAALVNTFVKMIGVFPVGALLKLDTGEIGLVQHQTSDLMRPRVLLLSRFDGSEKEDGTEVNLLETAAGRYKRSVAGTIDPFSNGIDVTSYLT